MERYIGVKLVEAELLSAEEAFAQGLIRADYIENQDGYKVVYDDGYISWSPKEVFEKAYKEIWPVGVKFLDMTINTNTGYWHFIKNEPTGSSN